MDKNEDLQAKVNSLEKELELVEELLTAVYDVAHKTTITSLDNAIEEYEEGLRLLNQL